MLKDLFKHKLSCRRMEIFLSQAKVEIKRDKMIKVSDMREKIKKKSNFF